MPERHVSRRVKKLLDSTGLDWHTKECKKHTQVFLAGQLVCTMHLSPRKNRVRASRNLSEITKRVEEIKNVTPDP